MPVLMRTMDSKCTLVLQFFFFDHNHLFYSSFIDLIKFRDRTCILLKARANYTKLRETSSSSNKNEKQTDPHKTINISYPVRVAQVGTANIKALLD